MQEKLMCDKHLVQHLYKTPIKKLAKFFESSRDNWKDKYFEKKKDLKRVTNRIYDLEKRKDVWKERAIKAEEKLKDMKIDISVNDIKKK
jgi:hypothetical protein